MRVDFVLPVYQKSDLEYTGNIAKNNYELKKYPLISYPKEYYLSFKGGNSLELKQTVKQLQKYGDNFPPGIEELAFQTLYKGNPDNEKLIDIHKKKYAELKDCDTLEELKFFFPEFSEVKSPDEEYFKYNKGSFIDKFKNGEIKTKDGELLLNPKKDLTVQLVQMYWADCLSLTDIQKACGYNIGGTLHKLNIPNFTPLYGQYIKLSDEESNKAIIEAAKRNRSISEGALKRKGIPLTPEHRKKISEALKEYYKTHENVGFSGTKEDAEYFAKNPYQSEIFSQILKRAWNYHEANSIKKALGKFMKKSDKQFNEDILKNPAQAMMLRDFWKRNTWAKTRWSACMTKSWARQKTLDAMGLIEEPKTFRPIMGKPFYEIIPQAEFENDEEFKALGTKNIQDFLSLAITDDGEGNKTYNVNALRTFIEGNGDIIINSNLDVMPYCVPKLMFQVLGRQIERCEKKPYLSKESRELVDNMKKIRDGIDIELFETYKANRNKEDLLKIFDIYVDLTIKCMENDSKEIKNIFEAITKQISEKNPGRLSSDFSSALQELRSASTIQDKNQLKMMQKL
ncbi:hypothetical protein IKQ26_07355 [bacterium]|nr:hypothetical protein [bacterium]